MAKRIVIIFIVALLFRFWQLTTYPVSLTMDEVAIGYGSYSLIHTGQDEWHQKLPIAFRSVGDYKPPVNFYLNIPPIAFIGLSEFAVRFPVALLGSLTPIMLLIFLRRIGFSHKAATFAAFWLAILPWHVHYSRYGLEAITALFFLLAGCATLFTSLTKKSYLWLAFTAACFSLSVWSYHSNRLFTPLLVIFLFILNRQKFAFMWVNKTKLFLVTIVLAVFAVPFIFLGITTPAVSQRAAMVSILREQSLMRSLHYGKYANIQQWVFDNDAYLIFHHWAGKYTDYFDVRFWFLKGLGLTPPGYPDTGLLYLVDLPLFIIGIFVFARSRNTLLKSLIVFWFFVGPLASSFTMNDQHTLRTVVWIPFFAFILAWGFERLGRKQILIYLLFLIINIAYVFDLYTLQFPKYFAEAYQYGFKQAAVFACDHLAEYDNVIISPTFGSLGPIFTGIPDYYVLFYCKYPPQKYAQTKNIDKFNFRQLDLVSEIRGGQHELMIGARWDFPNLTPPPEATIKRVDYFSEVPAFYFVDTKKVANQHP